MIKSQKFIIDTIKDNGEKIKSLGVQKIALFGSYARNEQTPESDIDLYVVMPDKQKTLKNLLSLYDLLESKFHSKTDIVTREAAHRILYKYIKNDLIYVQI